ncbi:MAG: hypothetical protein H6981_07185 [Gammaproteobacteria bacterium]|nr:hypothetical protein [Gammaproteobacteria bacterium]
MTMGQVSQSAGFGAPDTIVGRYVHLATHGELAMSFEEFAHRFAVAYLAQVPSRRLVYFDPADRRGCAKKLAKYFAPDAKVHLPAQLLGALVAALPEPYQAQARAEFAAFFQPPHFEAPTEAEALALAARVAKEGGEADTAYLAVAAGGINADDPTDKLLVFVREGREALSAREDQLRVARTELARRGVRCD